MSFKNRVKGSDDLPQIAHQEWRQLAALELRRRRLLRELADVEWQYRQLQLDIEFKGIEMPG